MSKTWLYPGILRVLRHNPARTFALRLPADLLGIEMQTSTRISQN